MPVGVGVALSDVGVMPNQRAVSEQRRRFAGVSWITTPAFVRDNLADGSLKALDVEGLAMGPSRICIVTLAGRTRSPAANMIADLARQAMADIAMQQG